MLSAELLAQADALLNQRLVSAERIFAGGNSRVYALTGEDGRHYALKHYFRHQDDPRDRLGVEFSTAAHLWRAGLRALPEPLAASAQLGLALYGFVEGTAPSADAAKPELDQAVAFLADLREVAKQSQPEDFSAASDACVCGVDLAARIAARLDALETPIPQIAQDSPLWAELRALVAGPLRASLAELTGRGEALLGPGLWAQALPQDQRVLSPSDFGFHNSLKRPDGTVIFLDFEYFGWDDPAKLTSDFLLHPRNPLPIRLKTCFLHASLELYSDLPGVGQRLLALYPLFALAWCAIMLNVFTPASLERRSFAGVGAGREQQLLAAQLHKARALHQALTHWTQATHGLTGLDAAFPLIG